MKIKPRAVALLSAVVALSLLVSSPSAFAKGVRGPGKSGSGLGRVGSPGKSTVRPYYGGGSHTYSHGGTYLGGSGASHQGGTYFNPKAGNRYGVHAGGKGASGLMNR